MLENGRGRLGGAGTRGPTGSHGGEDCNGKVKIKLITPGEENETKIGNIIRIKSKLRPDCQQRRPMSELSHVDEEACEIRERNDSYRRGKNESPEKTGKMERMEAGN